ncbi:MAG TPA: hypothetical protein VGY54_25905, partial [Polyangiaceae bacterium]|nr:hypothetical protein [Polyangiaceae bacterium]
TPWGRAKAVQPPSGFLGPREKLESVVSAIASDAWAKHIPLPAAKAGMLLVLAARCATAALRELDQAQRELVYRERQHKLAREALEKVLRALRYPEQKDKPQARVREAADRVLRAQRRAIRAQRDADEWQAEFDATARELVPIYAAALAEEKRANEQAERSRRVWRDAERAAAE